MTTFPKCWESPRATRREAGISRDQARFPLNLSRKSGEAGALREFPGVPNSRDPGRTRMPPTETAGIWPEFFPLPGSSVGQLSPASLRSLGNAGIPDPCASLDPSHPSPPAPHSRDPLPTNPIPEFFPAGAPSVPSLSVFTPRDEPFPPPRILRDGLFPENRDGAGRATGSGWDGIPEGWAGNGSAGSSRPSAPARS